jgi:hypothetical protein
MLELFDLDIPLTANVHIELKKQDKAGLQIECPVSYSGLTL